MLNVNVLVEPHVFYLYFDTAFIQIHHVVAELYTNSKLKCHFCEETPLPAFI